MLGRRLQVAVALGLCWTPTLAGAYEARIIDATVLDKAYPPEQVVAGLQGGLRPLGKCFVPADGGTDARGEVAFQINVKGQPTQLNVSGDLDAACVGRESSRWRFAPPTGETPQVFVTFESQPEAKDNSIPAQREREEFESFCMLFAQLQPRTQDPALLPRKVLRTLLASGMSPAGQRWASEMLATEPIDQLAVFQGAVGQRHIECPEYVGWYQRAFGVRGHDGGR